MKTVKQILPYGLAVILVSSFCSCGQKTTTWQEQYDLGVRYLRDGNYEEAIIAFTAAIEIDPKKPEAYMDLARLYLQVGDEAAAEEILRKGYDLTSSEILYDRLHHSP